MAVGTVSWMAYWWITAPIDYAITAFLPIAVNALVSIVPMSKIIANYASETIILLLSASILVVSWEESKLDKRIAVRCLAFIGPSITSQIVFWFLFSAVLSALLPNAVVCSVITPIAVSMLRHVGEGDIEMSDIGSIILMTIAWGAGIGGIATPLGGAMNLVIIEYLEKLTGREYMYVDWLVRLAPITLALAVVTLMYLLAVKPEGRSMNGTRDYFKDLYSKLPPMDKAELISLALFVVATVLAFTRQIYAHLLPDLKPAYVFVTCAILSFMITTSEGERLMKWKSTQTKVSWGLIYVFAGGLAAGTIINDSGAASSIGNMVTKFGLVGGLETIFAIIAMTLLLSDITSNTAAAAVAVPLVITIIQGMGLDPVPYIYVATIGINVSFMLPTSIRAIPVGYGLSPGYMFKRGLLLTIITIFVMSVMSYLLLEFWPVFRAVR